MTWSARAGLLLVRGYQLVLSPFSGGACRFEPSCSAYALTAVEIHGLVRGLWLTARRVARCHPLGRPGFDPVPPRVEP
jgi:putative membrane protein insertion efficiency factor